MDMGKLFLGHALYKKEYVSLTGTITMFYLTINFAQ